MKPAIALAAAFISARAGSATEPSTGTGPTGPSTSPPPRPGVGGRVRRALQAATVAILAACGGGGDPTQVTHGSIRGTVTDNTGATVGNAEVALTGNAQAARTTSSGADGVYTFEDVPPGTYSLAVTPPPGFAVGAAGTTSVTVASGAQADASAFVLDRATVAPGEWGLQPRLIEPLSELAFAESNGKLYLLGGYPASRQTSRTVQVFDIAAYRWELGPQLPQPNNHGTAATVNGKIYLIGGQTSDVSDQGYQNTVYELDPATGVWVTKAPMPTARGAAVAVAHDGKIYVAGGRPPRGHDFAVYDPATDTWEVLPNLPTQRNHFTGAAIDGRIHFVGGRQGHGLSPDMTPVHEVFDPQTRTWTTAAPMLRERSGMNGVMARGCFHVWGGEGPAGMFADHDYYDPRTNQWFQLEDMPIPVHGVYGSAFLDGLIWVSGGGTGLGGNHGSLHNQVYRPDVSCE